MSARLVIAVFAILVVAPACQSDSPDTPTAPSRTAYQVKYEVTGAGAPRADLTYRNANGGTAQLSAASLPWIYEWTGYTDDFAYVSAQNAGTVGCVTVTIYRAGAWFKGATSCGAYVIATASGGL